MDEVKALLQCHNFPDDLILNMDETSIDFDMPRSSIVAKKDAREVCIRGTKGGKKQETCGAMFSSRPNPEAHGDFQGQD